GMAPASVRRICIPGRSGVSVNQCAECLFKDVFCGDGSETINVAYFHERRSLNNFHRDRVITFEQIAE
ncbi:hypothetical protein, partial [Escherichia marmotae]|uniref:hypothetical protein n=1 Tax=Escherichia marmotae TaxID=1499973 RepID=UPI0028131B11